MKSGDIMKHRGELFAIAELWVVLFHLNNVLPCHLPFLTSLFEHGSAGVDMFLFLSALGLSFSLEKNSLSQYYLHRIRRVLVPSVCFALVEAVVICCLKGQFSLRYIVLYSSLLSFWVDGDIGLWYVSFILPLYAVFPLLSRMDRRTHHMGTLLLLAVTAAFVVLNAYSTVPFVETYKNAVERIPVFLCGMLAYPAVKADRKRGAAVLCGVPLLLTAVLWIVGKQINGFAHFLTGALGVSVIFLYSAFRSRVGIGPAAKWLDRIGAASLELYITHLIVLRFCGLAIFSDIPWYGMWAGVFCLSIALALAVHALFAGLWRRKTV